MGGIQGGTSKPLLRVLILVTSESQPIAAQNPKKMGASVAFQGLASLERFPLILGVD